LSLERPTARRINQSGYSGVSRSAASTSVDGIPMPTLHSSSLRPNENRFARISAGIASTLLAVLLSGCALTNSASDSGTANVVLGGKVHGGNQPIVGSNISLFATSATGYGGTLTPLASTTTTAGGFFTITTAYTCPAGSQAYIVAAGGNPGLGSGTDNSAIMLMAALGPCSSLSASTNIWLNEVTTVAAAYALSGFAPANNSLTETAVVRATSVPGFTTSATNTQGLSDAFANANNIVNFSNGQAYSTTPTTSANGTVPTTIINALADILQDCVNSNSPTSAPCASLFSAATPPSGSGVAAPVNVLQAALDIAEYPANNVATLYGLISAQSAFNSSALSTAPNDWSIGITYTNSLLVSGTGLGINNLDQVFVSGAGYLLDFSPQGAPLASTNLVAGSAITTTDTLREIAFDNTGTPTTSGNLFVTDGAATGVWKFNPNSNAVSLLNFDVAPVSEANNNTYGIAVDGLGDVWSSSYSKATCSTVTCPLVEFTSGTSYSPYSNFSGTTVNQPAGAIGGARGMAFDVKTGNMWITAIDDNLGELITLTPSAGGAATAAAAPTTLTGFGPEVGTPASNTAYGTIAVAVDSTSRAWFVVAGGPAVTGSHAASAVSTAIYPVSAAGTVGTTGITGGGLNTADTIIVDGSNNLFVANGVGSASASSVVEYSPSFNSNAGAFLSGTAGISPGSINTAGALSGGSLYEPSYIAIDLSGALWALSSGNGTTHPANLVQILGVAAPTNPVLAAGQYGVKP